MANPEWSNYDLNDPDRKLDECLLVLRELVDPNNRNIGHKAIRDGRLCRWCKAMKLVKELEKR